MGETMKVLLVKPPDRFLENEFVYQQLGPNYLQSYLAQFGILSDILVLYERPEIRAEREKGMLDNLTLDQLNMLFLSYDGRGSDTQFDHNILAKYNIIGLSVMTPQASDAYLLNTFINKKYPHITTVIGGSHPNYYLDQVKALPAEIAFDFIVPQDGWIPMHKIASGEIQRQSKSTVVIENFPKLTDLPAPTRPAMLMEKYNYSIAKVPAYHTITALGCPFTCNFCESGRDRVRKFSDEMIVDDLKTMSKIHEQLNHSKKALMFFDDVGLMSPKQVSKLSSLIKEHQYDTWRAFTHAYLVVRHKDLLLGPFVDSGGRRVGIGLETGSQKSLDMINKQNGKKQHISEHYEAVTIANSLGVAVDAFTMIYPWEDEQDLKDTTRLIEFIASSPVNGFDEEGQPLKNNVDSTIMSPYQGTKFYDMIKLGELQGVTLDPNLEPSNLYYKGNHGGSGWPYLKTNLAKERYEEEQAYRISLRPKNR